MITAGMGRTTYLCIVAADELTTNVLFYLVHNYLPDSTVTLLLSLPFFMMSIFLVSAYVLLAVPFFVDVHFSICFIVFYLIIFLLALFSIILRSSQNASKAEHYTSFLCVLLLLSVMLIFGV